MNTFSRKFTVVLLPLSGVIALTLTAIPAAHAAEFADFLFVVDESGSMSGEHRWLSDMIVNLDAALQESGVGDEGQGNRYGLVGFGSNSPTGLLGRSIGGGFFNTAKDFSKATKSLVTTGTREDGYAGIAFGLNNYAFRQGAAVNVVLITDEDRDVRNPALNFQNTLNSLQSRGALLNAVVGFGFEDGSGRSAIGVDSQGNAFIADGTGGFTRTTGGQPSSSGNQTTKVNYIDLAWATGNDNVGGAAWDLSLLRAGGNTAASFTNAFVNIKVEEVSRQGNPKPERVPEPSLAMGLMLLGTLGGAATRKRKQRCVA